MPTIFTHALVTGLLGKGIRPQQGAKSVALCALCGVLPDLDGVGFHLGVPYLHVWGHRGASHSLAFALAAGLLLGLLFAEHKRLSGRLGRGLFFGALIASHPLLDMLTTGGHGVALFAPLDHTRQFFPDAYRVIRVSPMSVSPRLITALMSELYWVWAPTLALYVGMRSISALIKRGGRPQAE